MTIRDAARRLRNLIDGRGQELRRLGIRVRELRDEARGLRVALRRNRADLKRSHALRYHEVLSPAIVRDQIPLRVHTLRARAEAADADRHDRRLQEISPAYRDAVAALRTPEPLLVETRVDGLTWWVPVLPSLSPQAGERFVAKQRFPYRNITQTRELAVGPVMLDIGSNIGRMAIPRVILGDVQRAYCAEPDPLNFTCLVRNIAANGLRGLVLPDRVAIGSGPGVAQMRPAKYSGGHRLVASPQAETSGTFEIPSCTLDDWCAHLAIDPDLVTFVKVDTQGWEVHVLRGAPDLLARRHIAWQLEVAPPLLMEAGTPVPELYELCAQRFTHFIDLCKHVRGSRARPTSDLHAALAYLGGEEEQTDIVLFNRDRAPARGGESVR